MRKLKIYFSDKKNYKLQKFVTRSFMTMLTAFSLTACSDKSLDKQNDSNIHISNETSNYQNDSSSNSLNNNQTNNAETIFVPSVPKGEISEFDKTIIDSKVVMENSDVYSLSMIIDEVENIYENSDLFFTRQALDNLENITYNPISNNIITNGKVDYNKLYDIVKQNSDSFLNNNSNITKYKKINDLEEICKFIAESINDELCECDYINLNTLDQKLSDLKVFEYSEFSNGFYSQNDGILGLNLNAINSRDGSVLRKIIHHESKHIIQANSKEEKENYNYDLRFGTSISYSNFAVNTLKWDWFFESSAESLTQKNGNYLDSDVSYKYGIERLNRLKIASLNTSYDLERLSFTSDINKVFDYFGCESEKDKEELINMFYAYNIFLSDNYHSSTADFYKQYEQKYGKKIDNKRDFEYSLRGNIGITQTKIFYKSLINKINGKEVNVKDIFTLISVFENELSSETWYSSRFDSLHSFYEDYNFIQSTFFELLASKLNITNEDVENAYLSFNTNYDNVLVDSFLGEESDSFINNESIYIKENKRSPIFYYYESIKKSSSIIK